MKPLPRKVDLRGQLPPVRDQGQLPTAVGFAIAACMEARTWKSNWEVDGWAEINRPILEQLTMRVCFALRRGFMQGYFTKNLKDMDEGDLVKLQKSTPRIGVGAMKEIRAALDRGWKWTSTTFSVQ